MLTAAQEDYIEVIFRLEQELQDQVVRISDIADRLGTRLPTVSRTVHKLAVQGYVIHRQRRSVRLSARGRRVAQEVLHRHVDLVKFFERILGLEPQEAERNACRIEHGLTARAAQRLHEFLEYVRDLPRGEQTVLLRFLGDASQGKKDFEHLPTGKISGWRS